VTWPPHYCIVCASSRKVRLYSRVIDQKPIDYYLCDACDEYASQNKIDYSKTILERWKRDNEKKGNA
jgi:hypothetical protein